MSWDRTFTHTLAYSLDIAGALIFWNTADITISAMCRIVQLADTNIPPWPERLADLRFYRWQVSALRFLAPALNRIQANHCELARQSDLERAARITELLQ